MRGGSKFLASRFEVTRSLVNRIELTVTSERFPVIRLKPLIKMKPKELIRLLNGEGKEITALMCSKIEKVA